MSEESKTIEHPGIELGRLIDDKGLTDASIADKCGLSRPLMSQITNGNRRITTTSAAKICKVLGGDPMYWIRRQRDYDFYVQGQQVQSAKQNVDQGVGRR